MTDCIKFSEARLKELIQICFEEAYKAGHNAAILSDEVDISKAYENSLSKDTLERLLSIHKQMAKAKEMLKTQQLFNPTTCYRQ